MTAVARRLILSLITVILYAVPAQAAIITLNYDFEASGFDAGAPVDPVTGSFSVTFDNTAFFFDVTNGVSVTGLNISLGSAPAITYFDDTDQLYIGGLENGTDNILIDPPTDDFWILLTDVSTTPTFAAFAYAQIVAGPGAFGASEGALTPIQAPSVPEPASLTLLGLGLAAVATRRWRQRMR